MTIKRTCQWGDGCKTILSIYNEGDLCRVHQREEERRKRKERIRTAMQSSLGQPWEQRTKLEDRPVKVVTQQPIGIKPNVDQVLQVICSSYEISMEELLGRDRTERVASPRQVAAYLLRTDFGRSFPTVAADLKRNDHTTIIHACKKITELSSKNRKFRENLDAIRSQYNSQA